MDKAITTALMIIISMVMALMLFNVAFPAITEGGDAIARMASRADERMLSQIEIVHAARNGELEAVIWVKNVGDTRVAAVERLDVFFGPEGAFQRIPHASTSGGITPFWDAVVENATDWSPTATLRITVHYGAAPATGRYFVKVVLPSGIGNDYFMDM